MTTAGVLLAAGAGRRMGMPKALMHHADGRAWLETSLQALIDGGCTPIAVVLGAEAVRARNVVSHLDCVDILENDDWNLGIGSSLRTALRWCMALDARVHAAMVLHVDTPGIGASVVRHMLTCAGGEDVLARATYEREDGPSHPVLLGRAHWREICLECPSVEGASGYLSRHPVRLIDCSLYGDGQDVDEPPHDPLRHA